MISDIKAVDSIDSIVDKNYLQSKTAIDRQLHNGTMQVYKWIRSLNVETLRILTTKLEEFDSIYDAEQAIKRYAGQ